MLAPRLLARCSHPVTGCVLHMLRASTCSHMWSTECCSGPPSNPDHAAAGPSSCPAHVVENPSWGQKSLLPAFSQPPPLPPVLLQVNAEGVFRYAYVPWFAQALQVLALSGVHGVAVDVWVSTLAAAASRS